MRRLAMVCVLTVCVLAACGEGDPGAGSEAQSDTSGAPPDSAADAEPGPDAPLYQVDTTVLESPEHGPQLCLGGVLTSMPPQCAGPDVIGWDWDDVEVFESASGTRWGEYRGPSPTTPASGSTSRSTPPPPATPLMRWS